MAQTEIQQMPKADFYANLRNKVSTLYNTMADLKRAAEYLATVDAATADAMQIPAGQIRTDLNDVRTAINELVDFFEGTDNTQTVVPKTVINKIRYI